MKLTVSRSKNSASFYVQKSIRKENGSVTTVTVEKLGNLDEVRTKANGKDPYVWAQEYVNELNRREYEEQRSIIISRSPSKLIHKGTAHSFNSGYLFLQSIYYSLGLDKIHLLNTHDGHVNSTTNGVSFKVTILTTELQSQICRTFLNKLLTLY